MTDQRTGSKPAAAGATAGTPARLLRVWRGDKTGGGLTDFTVPVNEGEVVLDVLHRLQATRRSGGTARPVSAARAAPRSTDGRRCCA